MYPYGVPENLLIFGESEDTCRSLIKQSGNQQMRHVAERECKGTKKYAHSKTIRTNVLDAGHFLHGCG